MVGAGMLSRIRGIPIAAKLAGIVVVAITAIGTCAAMQISAIRPAEMAARQLRVHSLVDVALGVVADFHRQATAGTLSPEAARHGAMAAIRAMRYSGSEYFWINDMPQGQALEPIHMIMHTAKPELDGTVISGMKDPDGVFVFQRFVAAVREGGAGFVGYRWPRPGAKQPVPKLSYVAAFQPWGWVIGTGIYVDDVDRIVADRRDAALVQIGVAVVVMIVVLVMVVLAIAGPIRRLTRDLIHLAAEAVAGAGPPGDGPPDDPGDRRHHHDEVGRMSDAVDVLRVRLAANRDLEREHEALRADAERHKREAAVALASEVDAVVVGVAERLGVAVTGMQHAADDLEVTAGQLAESVTDISGRVAGATAAADEAVREATSVTGTVAGLTAAAQTIGGVTTLIRGVAEQTNLLALNASIEAARAGAVGKGFAVVAGEVKALAAQSSDATDDIAREVAGIQLTSQDAAGTIDRMAGIVQRLGLATRSVASAVDGTGQDGAPSSVTVSAATAATGAVAQRIQQASAEVAAEALRLRTQFDDLVNRITAP